MNEEPSLLVLSNAEFALVDADLLPELSQFRWNPCDGGYARRWTGGQPRWELLHRRINQTPAHLKTDHANGNPSDNRRENLRNASDSQNNQNASKYRGQLTSQYKGVSFRKDRGTWLATISLGKKPAWKIGTFKTEIDAAKAYDDEARKHFGEFARLNFPDRSIG